MSLWLTKVAGMDSDTLREMADLADVDWDYQSIQYQARGIGYSNGIEEDLEAIQDAAESLLGYRPKPYNPPETN